MTAAEPVVTAIADTSDARARWLRRLGVLLSIATFAEASAILVLGSSGHPGFALTLNFLTFGFLGTIVLYPLVGALIVLRRPLTRVAWLMILLGLGLGFGLLSGGYAIVGQPKGWPLAIESLVVSQLFFVPSLGGATTLILLLFPTDRLPGRRWRIAIVIGLVGLALYELSALIRQGDLDPASLPGIRNPLAAPDGLVPLVTALNLVGSAMVVAGFFLAVVSLIVRYRHAPPVEAAQIRWVAFVALLSVPVISISSLPLGALSQLFSELGTVALAIMPIAVGVAITRYRLYDIDRLINRTIVYGSLTAILAGVFTAAVGLAQRLFVAITGETSDAAIVATTLIVATLYAPLRKRVDAIVDRRFKYERAHFGSYRDELQKFVSLADSRAAAERLAKEIVAETGASDVAVLDAKGVPTAVIGRWPLAEPVSIAIPGGHGGLSRVALGFADGKGRRLDQWRPEIEEIAGLAAGAVRRTEGR